MKRINFILFLLFTAFLFTVRASAYDYSFYPDESRKGIAEDEIDDMLSSLPDEIREKIVLPDSQNADKITEKYSFSFFFESIKDAITEEMPFHLNRLSVSVGMLILISLIRKSQMCLSSPALSPAINMCTCLASALTVYSMEKNILSSVGTFMKVISETMMFMVPIMEAACISGGNITTASVTATGINIMITFTESVFSNILSPAVSVCFLLSAVASVTNNKGIIFMSKTIRSIVTWLLVLIMSLMTLALTLQTGASSSADTFASRAIRFALGSYIPIVGGAVSDSFSLLSGSISAMKSIIGITGIVIIILICLAPLVSLMMAKFVSYIASNAAGMLDCDAEKELFSELGGCYTLLIAVVLSASIMYIIALSVFCKTSGVFK